MLALKKSPVSDSDVGMWPGEEEEEVGGRRGVWLNSSGTPTKEREKWWRTQKMGGGSNTTSCGKSEKFIDSNTFRFLAKHVLLEQEPWGLYPQRLIYVPSCIVDAKSCCSRSCSPLGSWWSWTFLLQRSSKYVIKRSNFFSTQEQKYCSTVLDASETQAGSYSRKRRKSRDNKPNLTEAEKLSHLSLSPTHTLKCCYSTHIGTIYLWWESGRRRP